MKPQVVAGLDLGEIRDVEPQSLDTAAVAWSISKADTAMQCLYKYKKVYVEGHKEQSQALALGNVAHDVIAKYIEKVNAGETPDTLEVITTFIKAVAKLPYEIDQASVSAIGKSIASFLPSWEMFRAHTNLASVNVEQRYAVTRDFGPTKFFGKNVFFRGVFDLWAYDMDSKMLIIADHKTNKSIRDMEQNLSTNKQLLMYAWTIGKCFPEIPWKEAQIGLHFLRFGKRCWTTVTREEVDAFAENYIATLYDLERTLYKCKCAGIYPRTRSFMCSWCSFSDECDRAEAITDDAKPNVVEGLDI